MSETLKIQDLIPFDAHPFKLYKDHRADELVESIQNLGVVEPIIVRPHLINVNKYEILSGHNRVQAAKRAGLTEIPAIIRKNLDDDDAMLIAVETNFNQRSFADWLPSEKISAISIYHEKMKRKNRRTDLTNETDELLEKAKSINFRQLGAPLRSDEETSKNFKLSPRTVSRFVQLNKLIKPMQALLDEEKFKTAPALDISFLKPEEQKNLNSVLRNSEYKLNMKNASLLRAYSEKNYLSEEKIREILGNKDKSDSGVKNHNNKKPVLNSISLDYAVIVNELIPNLIKKYDSLEEPPTSSIAKLIKELKDIIEI